MIIESILVVIFALLLDFSVGDPRSKYHPTAWIGKLIAKIVPFAKNQSTTIEKLGGISLVVTVSAIVAALLVLLNVGINLITIDHITFIVSIFAGVILLKTTIAIRGMEHHALAVSKALEDNDIELARNNLAMIVKRNTKNLDKNHVISGVLESISENTVDGITGPLFYFGLFGLPGAFVYRTINTIDSMIGYKNSIFRNIGWFGARCDTILNYIPARLTGLVMILATSILKKDWKNSYQIMREDGTKIESLNAGIPMAALAGALGTRFEKLEHYSLGNGNSELTKEHIHSAISIMKLSSILFCGIVTIPIIILLAYIGWWIHA
ncbi:MAG: cobalamin biosynthesis protein [Nitrosopumilaceae archaeon]